MSRTRIVYNTQGLFIGPAPSTGYHYVSTDGVFNDNFNDPNNINLVKSLYRVQSLNYGFSNNYTEIKQLGKDANITQALIEPPTVNLDFNYIQNGVINELRCGLYCNYTQIYGNLSGSAFYDNNTGVYLLSGLTTRLIEPGNNELHYPQSYRDKRNLFITVAPEGQDVNQTTYSEVNPNSKNYYVVGIGNAYLTKYATSAQVGGFPSCAMSYIGENMNVCQSGSGFSIPAVDYRTRNPINLHATIPADYQGSSAVKALNPGDITFSINSLPSQTGVLAIQGTGYSNPNFADIYNAGFKFSDLKIQSYDIDLSLNRENLNSLGYKLPIDRIIKYPIYSDCSVSAVLADLQTGDLMTLISQNADYNIQIKIKNPSSSISPTDTAIQYDFLRAKLLNVDYNNQIGGQESVRMSFRTELDPSNFSKGMFVSGKLNIEPLQQIFGYLLNEDGTYILQEDGSKIIVQQISPLI